MNTTAQQTNSSDLALAAITQALEEIAHKHGSHSRPEDQDLGQVEAARSPSVGSDAVSPGRHLGLGKTAVWSLIGCLAIVCVAAVVFAWPISGGRTAPSEAAPARISVAAMEKEPVTTQAISSIAATRTDKLAEQSAVQHQIVPKPADPNVSVPSEMTLRI